MRIYGIIDEHPTCHRGAFVVIDTESKQISYSCPTSPNADRAKNPAKAKTIAMNQLSPTNNYLMYAALFEYCSDIRGIGHCVDYCDPESITYDLDSASVKTFIEACSVESRWLNALRMASPLPLPQDKPAMDPEANLKEQLELANEIITIDESGDDPEEAYESAVRLAELVIALAEWNSKR